MKQDPHPEYNDYDDPYIQKMRWMHHHRRTEARLRAEFETEMMEREIMRERERAGEFDKSKQIRQCNFKPPPMSLYYDERNK